MVTVEFWHLRSVPSILCFLPFTCANTKKRKPPSESVGCSKPATAPPSKSSRLGVNLGASCRFFATICHFLRGLAALIEEGHTDEALKRIDELCEAGDRTAVRRFCANETVNIALSSFNSDDINRNGITANLRAAVPETVHVGDADLFSVLSNATWKRLSPPQAPHPKESDSSTFDLRFEDGQLLLLVSNTFDRAPRMVDGMP